MSFAEDKAHKAVVESLAKCEQENQPSLWSKQFRMPRILEYVLAGGATIGVPCAIGLGVTLGLGDANDAVLVFYWFHGAAILAAIAVFLWEEVVRLGKWRVPVTAIAMLIIMFSVWEADAWAFKKVEINTNALISSIAKEMKATADKALESRKSKSVNSASITEDISALHHDGAKAVKGTSPANGPPTVPVIQLPSMGNLKQRTSELSESIEKDFSGHLVHRQEGARMDSSCA